MIGTLSWLNNGLHNGLHSVFTLMKAMEWIRYRSKLILPSPISVYNTEPTKKIIIMTRKKKCKEKGKQNYMNNKKFDIL